MGLVSELRRRNVLRMAVLYGVTAWLIMQVVEVILSLAALPEWVGQALLGILAIGFPIALVFSWVYEITPEGLKPETEIDPSDSIAHVTGRRMDFIVIAMLAAAVIVFAYDKWWLGKAREIVLAPANSIAVLAFANMSPDPEQEFFSDGISEELLNLLAQVPGLKVIARTSSFSFKGEKADVATIAERLNVRHVVEGSVRRSGDKVRITAQLIDATDSTHIWSQTYDRKLTDIFAIQDEISAAIVGAVKDPLGLQVEAVPRVIAAANTEAYEAYLRGRYLVVQRTLSTIEGAILEFENAIALDPDFALGHAELAQAIWLQNGYGGGLTDIEAVAKAAPHAERATTLDPNLAEAHAATGCVLWTKRNLEKALAHFEQATQINPNYSIAFAWMGNLLNTGLGFYAEGFAASEASLRLNPLSIPARSAYVGSLTERNRLDEADRELEKLASIAPANYAYQKGVLTSLDGKWADSVMSALDALQIDPTSRWAKGIVAENLAVIGLENEVLATPDAPVLVALWLLGKNEAALAIAEAQFAEEPNSLWRRNILGWALAGAGDYARARPILEELWQQSGRRVVAQGWFTASMTVALIATRHAAGEEAGVEEFVAAIRDNVRRYREAGMIVNTRYRSIDYEEGLADYLAGEREKGLALIAKAAEDGYFILTKDAFPQAIHDDPGFAPIRARQEALQARERDRFLASVCTDNPYAAVWQPEAGTCERFTGAGEN